MATRLSQYAASRSPSSQPSATTASALSSTTSAGAVSSKIWRRVSDDHRDVAGGVRFDARQTRVQPVLGRAVAADAHDYVAPSRFDPRVVVETRDGHAADYRSVRRSLSVS